MDFRAVAVIKGVADRRRMLNLPDLSGVFLVKQVSKVTQDAVQRQIFSDTGRLYPRRIKRVKMTATEGVLAYRAYLVKGSSFALEVLYP